MNDPFKGLWPALLTPLDSDGKPALGVLEQLVDAMVREGVDGLYIVGSTGQWPMLSVAERQAIAETCVKAANRRLPIMVQVGSMTTADAVTLARHAQKIGADAISTVGPTYFGFTPDAVFEHYRRIGQAGELPLFVYHLAGVAQVAMPPREFVQRLLHLPNIAGMKFTDKDLNMLGLIHSHGAGKLKIFSGHDEVLCQAVLSGAVGAIGTFYNLWGGACKKAREATAKGDTAAASRFMANLQLAIAEVLAAGSMWSFLRQAMKRKYRIDVGMPRPPLGIADREWSDADLERLIHMVDG